MDRAIGFDLLPFVPREIERVRLERAVTARFVFIRSDAILVIILDCLTPALQRLVGCGIAHDEVVFAQVIEQSSEPLLEQWQPMLHSCHSPAV